MAPLVVLIIATIAFHVRFPRWKDAVRYGLAVMFLFTAASHFTPELSRDMAAMIPPPLTGSMWIIWLTGVLEAAGAIGLMTPQFRKAAAICLILFLIAVFPANVYAAVQGVPLGGRPPTPLWFRTILQCLWIALLGWSSLDVFKPLGVSRPEA